MASLSIEIPGEVVEALGLPQGRAEEELRREFAVFLVRERLLSPHRARLLTRMERLDFEDLLARRRVPWNGTAEEVAEETAVADRLLRQVSPG